MSKKEMIGLDRTCKPVYVGDTIQDAEGVKYTITERGTAVGPGGKEVQYHTIKGPELCSDEQKQEAPAAPVKKEEKIFPKRRGGKENKSGLVSLGSLARRLQVKQAGIARTLRAGGIEVVKGKNGYGIRVADVEKAEQLLAPLNAALPEMKKIGLGDVLDASKQPDGPAVDFAMLGVEDVNVGPMEEDLNAWRFAGFTDQELADALRYRGYEVTATKTVVVSL